MRMGKNKICPYCGALIADDSFYCDQCGKQLLICPNCHEYGKGKFCKHCGSPMQVVCDEIFTVVSTAITEASTPKVYEAPQDNVDDQMGDDVVDKKEAEDKVDEEAHFEDNTPSNTQPLNDVGSNPKESISPAARLPKLTIKL